MAEKSDGNRKMPKVLSWQDDIATIAGPMRSGDTRESWLARAARKAGITFRQCKALYYGETTDPKYSVGVGIDKAASEARAEALRLAAQFESLAGSLNARDQDFHSEDIAALVNAARSLRGVDRA